MKLEGQVALVTGAARGIGRGIALRMAAEGADIVVNDLTRDANAESAIAEIEALGRRALFVEADVSDRAAVEQMFAQAIAFYGRLNIVVANAALSIREPVVEAHWEHVLRTLEVTQFGVFHTCQFAAQHLVEQGTGGKIIIISSIHAELPVAGSAGYNMAKAAITHLGGTLAAEVARHRINVNTIFPGWIDTPGERAFATEEELREGGERIPWGRLGTPADIGGVAAFLASADADYITGSTLRVDGGYTLGLTLA